MDLLARIEAVFDDIRSAAASDSAAAMLMGMSESLHSHYIIGLQVLAKEFGWHPLTAAKCATVLREIDARIDCDTDAYFRHASVEEVLRETINDLGTALAGNTFIYTEQPSLNEFSQKGIHFVITRDQTRAQFGDTTDMHMLGIAFSKVNLRSINQLAFRVVLHEYGHAFHFQTLKTKYPSLRAHMPRFYFEALAQVMESVADDRMWLEKYSNATTSQVAQIQRLRLVRELYRLKENIAFATMETILPRITVDIDDVWSVMAHRMLYPHDSPLESFANREFGRYFHRIVHHEASALQVVLTQAIAFAVRRHMTQNAITLLRPTFGTDLGKFTFTAGDWYEMLSRNLGYEFNDVSVGDNFSYLAKGILP